MSDKLIENIAKFFPDNPSSAAIIAAQIIADLTTNLVPQLTPITNERLLKLAEEMYPQIFLNTGDEQKVYDEVLGYGGKIEMPLPEAPKETT